MIGIIGYGRFGRLMAGYLARDFKVVIYQSPRTDPTGNHPNITFGPLEAACRQRIVIPSVPIGVFRSKIVEIAPLLAADALVVDVCSVKTHPVEWMRRTLPAGVSILATHPMFGPDSAAQSLAGSKIVLCPVRIADRRFHRITSYLESKGLITIEATPEEHDRQIAHSLGLTHFIGRALAEFGAARLTIDTEGYKRLLHILGVVENDTWQLFEDMHHFNPYAAESRAAFRNAVEKIEDRLNQTEEESAHANRNGPSGNT